MPNRKSATIMPGELLDALKEYPFLNDLNLAIYCEQEGLVAFSGIPHIPCEAGKSNQLCSTMCIISHETGARQAFEKREPVVYSCNSGLLNFAVPIKSFGSSSNCCLIGGSLREKTSDRAVKKAHPAHLPLLDYLDNVSSVTNEQMEELAYRVWKLVQSLQKTNIYSRLLEKTLSRFRTVSDLAAEIEKIDTVQALSTLLGDALGILFDIHRVALLLPEEGRTGLKITGIAGLPCDMGRLDRDEAAELIPTKEKTGLMRLRPEQARLIVPDSTSCAGMPLQAGNDVLGLLLLFDHEIPPRELLPLELLVEKAAARIKAINTLEEFERQSAVARKFMNMTGILSLAKSKEEVYRSLLDMAADLLRAANGSLMLVDEARENLRIEVVKGMSVQVAKSMSIKIGRGIAGKVAKTGHPLLVNNIENDSRTRLLNRPRFKSKSFISLPLRLRDVTIGVLNLSDKGENEIFTEADLEIVTTFINQAMMVLERMESTRKATELEQLSVTDPLTGLYNRRLLETRMVEELNRSYRQKQVMTIMLIDLDNFKVYNDICGHLSGDNVLKRVAVILKENARSMDIVTRYGGEEFCILLPSTSKKESMFVAERIRRAIENEVFQNEEHLPLGKLTASIGIACYPEDGINSLTLLHAADIALYQAKEEGRNRIVIFGQRADSENKKHPLQSSQPQ